MDIVGSLRDDIVSGRLPPGAALPEPELAGRFGVDPEQIRDVLAQLVAEDLARFVAGRGVFVSEISVPDLVEVLQLHDALEPAVARLAAGAVRAGVPSTRLAELEVRLSSAAVDAREAAAALGEVDRAIGSLAGNDRIQRVLDRAAREGARARMLLLAHDAQRASCVERALGVLRAIRAGDVRAAEDLARARARAETEALLALVGGRSGAR